DMQEMKKELEKVRARCKELKQAGAGEDAADVDRVRTKEARVWLGLERAAVRGMKMRSLEEELEVLVSRKLYLEKMGSNEEELNKVRTREMEMRVDLTRLRVMSVDERNLELELDKLVAKQKEIEATVDVRRREIELSRLREEAKAGSSDRELELTLRLEYVKARVRALELELGLWLGKIEEKRTGTGGRMTSLVLGESEIARVEREVGSIAMSEVVSEVIVVQDETSSLGLEEALVVEEEGAVIVSGAGSLGLEEALVVEEEGAVTVSEASSSGGNDGRGGEDWQVPSSSELDLEQGAVSDNVEGVVLPPHLARSLGMSPGSRIFRSMFYGTPQAPLVSSLAAQLLDEYEATVSRALGEVTSSFAQSSDGDFALRMDFIERTIQVLLDSIEAPQPQVAPAVVVEGGDTTHWQAPGSSAPEQSTGGSVLAPDLARLEQRMYTIHLLRRSMLRSAPPPKTVKKREGKEEKLRRKEQEKEEKLRKKRQEKEKRLGEKEANKEIAATKSRERELGMVISVAVCREAELERVRVKVLEVPELLSSRRKRDIEMVEARERE
ncbi:hypothetical protein, partial [Candidatus Ichthyocystis sparus]|uniref:hypothetical protein n=1 Tax=Candidatus Ichthyocystis sparus TaxID=1561004 RepID=UPI00159EDE3A